MAGVPLLTAPEPASPTASDPTAPNDRRHAGAPPARTPPPPTVCSNAVPHAVGRRATVQKRTKAWCMDATLRSSNTCPPPPWKASQQMCLSCNGLLESHCARREALRDDTMRATSIPVSKRPPLPRCRPPSRSKTRPRRSTAPASLSLRLPYPDMADFSGQLARLLLGDTLARGRDDRQGPTNKIEHVPSPCKHRTERRIGKLTEPTGVS